MKLGFALRKVVIRAEELLRRAVNIYDYLLWLLFSPAKFSRINKNIKNLLVAEVAGIGDIVNMAGIVNSLKNAYPNLDIYFVTRKDMVGFLSSNKNIKLASPDVNEILGKVKIDAAVINGNIGSRYSLYKKIKNVVYVEGDSIISNLKLRGFFNTRRKFPLYWHWIKRRLLCFEMLGFKVPYKLSFYSSKEDEKNARHLYNKLNPKKRKVVLLNPNAGTIDIARDKNLTPSHEWQAYNFSKLADKSAELGCLVLITGTLKDEPIAKEIISKCENNRTKSICGMFSVGELGEFMKLCSLLVSIDTGTVHIATSANLQTIDLMGPYPVKLYAAWNPSDSIQDSKAITIFHKDVCNGCRKYHCPEKNPVCMNSISVDEVYEIAKKFI